MRRHLLLILFLCLHWAARGQSGYDCRYWVDTDDGQAASATFASGTWQAEIDFGLLSPGFHALHIQVCDTTGTWSSPVTRYFFKTAFGTIRKCDYWFDDETEVQQLTGLDGPSWIDVSRLSDGFHRFRVQTGEVEAPSQVVTKMFIKIPQTKGEGADYMTCIFSVDEKPYKQERVPAQGGCLTWNLDVADLDQGIHRLSVWAVTASGVATNISEHFFFRTTLSGELRNMKCYYSIDGDDNLSEVGTYDNGLFHFDINVAGIEDGLHRISYFLDSEKVGATRINTAYFVKTPLGGNGIARYDYWLNDRYDMVHTTLLDERTNPYSLISLLPVETCPIRSSCFHFEVEEGQPTLYARNDIHIRFYDASGRFTDVSEQYVDYAVSEPVEDIKEIVSGQSEWMTKPSADEIKWFSLYAERGDSLQFKSNMATSLQLFSPSGKPLYDASGAESTSYDGCHVTENGTYYLALHDVTSSKSGYVALDYNKISKFDVLDYSPRELGVLPCTHLIDLDGNGYDNLKAVYLRNGDTQIAADTILVTDKARATLMVNLSGNEAYGNYDIVLEFDDGEEQKTKTIEGGMALTAPRFRDIDINITDPRRVASPYPVSITLTNNSNLTYIYIPFYFAYDNIGEVQTMTFENFAIDADEQFVESGMAFDYHIENFKDKNKAARMVPAIIPALKPGESRTYIVGFEAGNHAIYNVYAWTGTPWNMYAGETMQAIRTLAETSGMNGSWPLAGSCMPGPCEYTALTGSTLDGCDCESAYNLSSTFGNMYLEMLYRHDRPMRESMGDKLGTDSGKLTTYRMRSPGDIFSSTLGHCLPETPETLADAYNALQEELGQDPCPEPISHSCNQYNPGDPNDILGYRSESGSTYMRDDVANVYFTIECENDPELATAAAHKVVITDTIDARFYDLTTFTPTGVNIGGVDMELDGTERNFIKTLDLRPRINVIAQVQLEYSTSTGIARWTMSSLDPMTMEETDDIMQGILPINVDGNGQGQVTFNIRQKTGLAEGTEITNRAGIVFDNEEAILTPVWTNIIDVTPPTSRIEGATFANNTLTFSFSSEDNLSGIWKYDLYMQKDGDDAPWVLAAADVAADSTLVYGIEEGIDYGFCVLATDSAGNVEQKELTREYARTMYTVGDVNTDGKVDMVDAMMIFNKYLGKNVTLNPYAADVNEDGIIDIQDAMLTQKIYLTTEYKQEN